MNDRQFTSDPRVAYMSAELRRSWDPENDFRFRRWPPAEFELHRATVLMRGFGSFASPNRTPKVKLTDFRVKPAPRRCPGPR